MTQKQSAIAASVQKASRGNAAFVFASSPDQMPKTAADLTAALGSTKFSKFGCVACGTAVHARADTTPFCITCGSEGVHQLEAEAKPTVTAKSDLVALNCTLCSASTVVEAGVATAITSASKSGPTPIHCSCCGNPLTVTSEADATANAENLGVPALKTPEPAPTPSVADADTFDGDDDLDLDNLGSLDDMDDDGDEFGDTDGDSDGEPAAVVSDPATMSTPGAAVPPEQFAHPEPEDDFGGDADVLQLEPFSLEEVAAEPVEPTMPSSFETDDFGAAEDQDVSVVSNEEVGDPLVDALDMDDTEMALAFVKASGRLVAMKGHVAVASLSAKSKSVNAGLINSPALQAAARASVASEGLRAGLQSVGFTLVKVPVTSKATVERRVQEITAKTASQEDKKQKVFAQAFAIAAAGLNRGQWKGVENPLRAAMETELTRAGVEQPRRVVSAVFESAGLAYAQALLETSNRLSKMSASARNDLSEVLNMTATVSPEEEHDDATSNPEAAPVEARFATGGKTTAALLRPHAGSSSQSVTAASSILAGKAPLSFSF